MSSDQRRFHRILFQTPARLHSDGRDFACRVVDLSIHGCLLQAAVPLPGHGRLEIELAPDRHIALQVHRVHQCGDRAGFVCDHIDLEDLGELRRLVELNLGDSTLLERDFTALCPAAE